MSYRYVFGDAHTIYVSTEMVLRGFKYIGNTGLDLVRDGYEVPFGYEEAIGFMFGNEIRDKDGVAATVCLATCSRSAAFNFFYIGFLRRTRRIC